MPSRRYAVGWAELAVLDLEEIAAFIAQDSEASAQHVTTRIRARASALERAPARGRIVPELQRIGVRRWREVIIAPYRLVYRIEAQRVVVVGLFDGRRDLDDVLLDRLVRIAR